MRGLLCEFVEAVLSGCTLVAHRISVLIFFPIRLVDMIYKKGNGGVLPEKTDVQCYLEIFSFITIYTIMAMVLVYYVPLRLLEMFARRLFT